MRKCVGLIILIGWLAGGSVSATDQKNQVIVFNSITFNENWSDLFLKMIYRQISDRDSIVFETYELVLPQFEKRGRCGAVAAGYFKEITGKARCCCIYR